MPIAEDTTLAGQRAQRETRYCLHKNCRFREHGYASS
jgi:hypothetical protein